MKDEMSLFEHQALALILNFKSEEKSQILNLRKKQQKMNHLNMFISAQ